VRIVTETKFQVFIDGKQVGSVDKWDHTPLMVTSRWEAGSNEEKYEVLAAIRKTYAPDNKADIRGKESQAPSQIGRGEGFKELKYSRTASSAPSIVIVPPVMQYLRLVPQAKFNMTAP